VQGFPTFFFFASRKEKPYKFNRERTVDEMINFVFDQMRSLVNRRKSRGGQKTSSNSQTSESSKEKKQDSNNDDVIILTDSNFDSYLKGSKELWMVKFYGILCEVIDSSMVWTLQEYGSKLERSSRQIKRKSQIC
jgi:hypothetical protein